MVATPTELFSAKTKALQPSSALAALICLDDINIPLYDVFYIKIVALNMYFDSVFQELDGAYAPNTLAGYRKDLSRFCD